MGKRLLEYKTEFYANFKNYRAILHLLYWIICAVVFYFLYKSSVDAKIGHLPPAYIAVHYLLRYVVSLALCYSFLYLVVPLNKGKNRSKFWIAFIVLLSFWYLVLIVGFRVNVSLHPELKTFPTDRLTALWRPNLLPYIFMFAFFIAIYYFVDIYDRQKEIQKLQHFKTEKIALESRFLKSQINPHFLFNTLNNIYALSLKKSGQTSVIIDRLESLLHYMLYECKEDLVPLSNEFIFTQSYIDLEKLRHREERCEVKVNITGDAEKKMIAPLLLINFLENAFKHGTKTSFGKSWIYMDINVEPKKMHFVLKNSKPSQPALYQGISEYKGGIGLKNVKRRLEILYPKKHILTINDNQDYFEVCLELTF